MRIIVEVEYIVWRGAGLEFVIPRFENPDLGHPE
jgi:hypothetical protein